MSEILVLAAGHRSSPWLPYKHKPRIQPKTGAPVPSQAPLTWVTKTQAAKGTTPHTYRFTKRKAKKPGRSLPQGISTTKAGQKEPQPAAPRLGSLSIPDPFLHACVKPRTVAQHKQPGISYLTASVLSSISSYTKSSPSAPDPERCLN